MWVFKSLSALIFLIGCMTLVVAAVWVWITIAAYLVPSVGWFAGVIYLAGTFFAMMHLDKYIRVPWQLWFQLWRYADKMILDRHR